VTRRVRTDYLGLVRDFHLRFEIAASSAPTGAVEEPLRQSREALMVEELQELLEAMATEDPVEIADGLADLLYVVFGTAVVYGIPMDEVFLEVHRSNMSKLGSDGKPLVGANGKRLKGPNFRPPDITPLLV
jgi:predicted HAD superfamily Cof-like phosphohydrolase